MISTNLGDGLQIMQAISTLKVVTEMYLAIEDMVDVTIDTVQVYECRLLHDDV